MNYFNKLMRFFFFRRPISNPASALLLVFGLIVSPIIFGQINLPNLGDSLSGTISTQQEYEYGRELLRSIRQQTPQFNDPLIEEYITNVTYKLAANSELSDHRLEFVLIDSEALNAFAAPGGIIGVNAGLFQFADNEGQFASVLAHELAHISQRHYARQAERQRNNALPNLATMLASIVVAATVGGEAGEAAIATTQALSVDNQLRYSRSHESEADRVGIRTLYNSGFNPVDMAGMFENMMRINSFGRDLPEFLSTHPLDETRIADSKNRANNYGNVNVIYNLEYLLMRERVRVHYAKDPEIIASSNARLLLGATGQQADAARYGLALAQLEQGRFADASENLDTLIRKEPLRITYVILQADIARESGNLEKALDLLEDNLKINPANHPLTMSYALTLEADEQYQKAADILQKQTLLRPNDSSLWYHLAEIQGLAGNISLVHQARAEYFFTVGEFGRAREQLFFAEETETDPIALARIKQRRNAMTQIQNRFYR